MGAILIILKAIFSLSNIRKWVGFLVANWKPVLVCTFAALFLYENFSPHEFLFGLPTIPSLKTQMAQAKNDIKILDGQLQTCAATNKGLSSAITDQNTNIKGWSDLGSKIDASTQAIMSNIQKSRAQSHTDVQNILNQPTPQSCQEALKFMRDAVSSGELKWAPPAK